MTGDSGGCAQCGQPFDPGETRYRIQPEGHLICHYCFSTPMACCGWRPVLCDDGRRLAHDVRCPHFWGNINTAEDVARLRGVVMTWAADLAGDDPNRAELTRRLAEGIHARAVELGLEPPD